MLHHPGGLTFSSLILDDLQLLHIVRIIEPELHTDERLPALDAQHVPRFRLGEELTDGALRQTQHSLTKDLQRKLEPCLCETLKQAHRSR